MVGPLWTPPASGAVVRLALYRALLRGASQLEQELRRCESLRAREVAQLLRVTPSATEDSTDNANQSAPLYGLSGKKSRALGMAVAASPVETVRCNARSQPHAVDYAFAALRHINSRVAALEKLVYHNASEAVTADVRVRVESEFVRYEPNARRYFFAYNVTMTNEGRSTMQLLSRKWIISDLNGAQTEVEGPGVVGNFPILRPGQRYEYSSATPLRTPLGTQAGHFLFISHDQLADWQSSVAPSAHENTSGPDLSQDTTSAPAQAHVIKVAPFSLRNDDDATWGHPPENSPPPDQHVAPEPARGSSPGTSAASPAGGPEPSTARSRSSKVPCSSPRGRRLRLRLRRPRHKR